jgi:Zinc carboxypeptidase
VAKSHTLNIGGSKVKLSRSATQIAVRPNVGMTQSMENAIRSIAADTPVERRGRLGEFEVVHVQASPQDLSRARTNLRAAASVHQEVAVYHTSKDNVPFIPVGTIFLSFKPGLADDVKQAILDKYGLRLVASEPNGFLTVRVTEPGTDSVEVAAKLQREKSVAVAEPDLLTTRRLRNFVRPTDPLLADDIRSVVEGLQLVVFPCVNPDGRHHSQTAEPMWRKNRRRAVPSAGADCVGVDINRNFDALWDFRRHFAPDSHVSASDNPCDPQVYVGPAAASEAETRNVVSLLDRYPRVRWFVDIHSYVPAIFYNWGFDVNQTSDPTMNFRNAAFDGKRGRGGDAYQEFIPADDLHTLQDLGGKVNHAITTASGTGYDLEQSFTLYPTSGASDDYAFSRHFVQGANSKILSFTIECGRSFQPPWTEAEDVIREVCAGLVALCVDVAAPGA